MPTRQLIGIAAVLILAFKVISPSFTPSDIIGLVVVVPCLTIAIYEFFCAFD